MMSILIFNAGSSSLKYTLFNNEGLDVLVSNTIAVADDPTAHRDTTRGVLEQFAEHADLPKSLKIEAIGHRVVHGGSSFHQAVIIDSPVKETIQHLNELAPLHNPPALALIQAATEAFPDIPQIAVFDTAFFAHLPPAAHIYPLPYKWYTDWGIRRFGFHGISHAYCAERAAALLTNPRDDLRLVICHLGSGCSASAVKGSQAVTTTMGFTPLEGLMMGTRSGSIDPGILLHLLNKEGISPAQLRTMLNRESGLLGVSGISADFRQVQTAAKAGDERAQLALDIFANRVRGTIGSLAVTMGGVDALIFTAGIGENAPELRYQICQGLECLDCHLDDQRNNTLQPDADLAQPASPVRILAIHTREDFQIAKEVRKLHRQQSGKVAKCLSPAKGARC